ncbi:MAG: hypothetical protein ACTS2F_12235 [Thainema sp.]
MNIDRAFHQILLELLSLHQQARLHLPASQVAIEYQLRQIHHVQHQLQDIEQRVALQFGRGSSQPVRQCHQRLVDLIRMLQRRLHNLVLLAEEFEIDPEGTIACLRCIDATDQQIIQHVEATQSLQAS